MRIELLLLLGPAAATTAVGRLGAPACREGRVVDELLLFDELMDQLLQLPADGAAAASA